MSRLGATPIDEPLLRIEGLSVTFDTSMGRVRAAQDVCLDLFKGEALALVGETGCGKSVVANSILQLLPGNASVRGSVTFSGRDLLSLSEREMAEIRGREIAIVFQNPSLALNPIIKAEEQIAEPLQIHRHLPRSLSIQMAKDMLRRLGLGMGGVAESYPFQLSGGMNQRVMIAAAMILSPRIIIADEPSKGLDRLLARQIAEELGGLRDKMGASLLLITHDLLLARDISDRISVMYCGEVVETGESQAVFDHPLHPYTKALLDCLPQRGFHPIPGVSPSMIDPPGGCKFYPRCRYKHDKCMQKPDMTRKRCRHGGMDREVRCWLY